MDTTQTTPSVSTEKPYRRHRAKCKDIHPKPVKKPFGPRFEAYAASLGTTPESAWTMNGPEGFARWVAKRKRQGVDHV